jgi:hypothetical protein
MRHLRVVDMQAISADYWHGGQHMKWRGCTGKDLQALEAACR